MTPRVVDEDGLSYYRGGGVTAYAFTPMPD